MHHPDFTARASSPHRRGAELAARVRRARPPCGRQRPSLGCALSSNVTRRYRASTVFNAVALVVGAVALAVVTHHLGWEGVRQVVLGTGAWFLVIAVIDVASALCDAFAIHGFLRPTVRVSYRRVLAAQLGGMAINRLTPASTLGEPVKVAMLVRALPVEPAVSAIVMFNLTTMYVGIAAIALGVPITALLLDLPAQVALAAWIGLAVVVAFGIAVLLLVRRGALATLVEALVAVRAISAARGARWRAKVAAIDARLGGIADTRRSGLRRGLAGVLGSRVLNWAGTVVVLHAADIPMTAPLVVAMLGVGILITWMSNIIPLGLGIADGTNYILYGLLGAAPVAGLLFTMVNRLRTVVLALIGLTVLAVASALDRRNAGLAPVFAPTGEPAPRL